MTAQIQADFGPMVHTVSVDKAIISFLIRWLPTYLHASEVREGKPTNYLSRPTAYGTTYDEDDNDFFADGKMPRIMVTAGEFQDWQRTGDDWWSATSRVAITVVSRARHLAEGRYQASLYIASVTELLLDKPGIEGLAGGVHPVSERPRPIDDPSNRSRVLTAGMGVYDVFLPNVRRARGGPLDPEPPTDPTVPIVPLPTVVDVDIDFTGLGPGQTPNQ